MKRRWGAMAAIWLSFSLPHASYALGNLKFGPEFSLGDIATGSSVKFIYVHSRMRKHLEDGQPDGEKFTVIAGNEYGFPWTFRSPNGWWFEWHQEGTDENCGATMEIRMSPGSVEFFRHFKDDMQDAIFASAANEGIYAPWYRGGGHINISATAFDSDLLLRNFIVDMINHDELFMGILGYDTNNALPFQLIPPKAQQKVYKVIDEFDRGLFGRSQLLDQIQKVMRREKDPFLPQWKKLQDRGKHFAFNFIGMIQKYEKLEIRGVRPQASMDVWVRQIDLLAHRLAYLDQIKQPISIQWKVPVQPINLDADGENHMLNPPVDPQLALRAFYEYVTESGLKWQDHRDYLWPKWMYKQDGESQSQLEIFEQSEWFLQQEAQSRCEQYLGVAG